MIAETRETAAAGDIWPAIPAAALGNTVVTLVPPVARRIRLSTIDDVAAEVRRVYRDMRGGRLDTQAGGRLVFVLSSLAKLMEASVIERRLQALETQTNAFDQ